MFGGLKMEMIKREVSVPKLAEKIGISKKTLYSRMRGDTSFTQSEIVKISNVLSLDNEQMLSIFFTEKVS